MELEDVSVGDEIPPHCEIIEVRVTELRQLFNAMDPSPFYERDLDPKAEAFIVGWASDISRSARLGLLVHVDGPPGATNEVDILRQAVHQHFRRESDATKRRLRVLFQRGRVSLAIGLAFLGLSGWLAKTLATATNRSGFEILLRESLIIGGWVAMWRPMEVFLYDWWPIRAEARRYDRLAAMPVRIQYSPKGPPSPATSPTARKSWSPASESARIPPT
jgi:hypothetical protein